MRKINILITLLLLSSVLIGQPIVNLLIQVVDVNNNPVDGYRLFIKHPGWNENNWIPDQGRSENPSISDGEFINSFTMNSQRHNAKYNLYSSLLGISDIYSSFPYGKMTTVDLKLVKSGHKPITDQIDFMNRDRGQYVLIEKTYLTSQQHHQRNNNNNNYNTNQVNDYYLSDINKRATIMLVSYQGRTKLFTFVDGYPLRRGTKPVLREFDENQHSFSGGSDIWVSPGNHTITVKSRDGSIKRSKKFILGNGDYEQWNIK